MIEVTIPHTGLLRLGLAIDQSVVFWSKATHDLTVDDLCIRAEQEAWFGSLTASRRKYIVKQLQKRFPFEARKLLGFRPRPEPEGNALICHWHLQLTDPLYRDYTSRFLMGCWSKPATSVSMDDSTDWVKRQSPSRRWAGKTQRRMASGLMRAATEAGLASRVGRRERELRLPNVSARDIHYLTDLLQLAGAGQELETYLISVGKSGVLEEC